MNSIQRAHGLAELGAVANRYAERNTFDRYRDGCSENTLKAQRGDLGNFSLYIMDAGGAQCDMTQVSSWAGMTWGLVDGYVQWMLRNGYTKATVNRRLATVRVYAELAAQGGVIDDRELRLIQTVKGVGGRRGREIDNKRAVTRVSNKKAEPVRFTSEQVDHLIKRQPSTPKGRRDRIILTMLFRQGLRAGEIVALTVDNIDFENGRMTFYREKVGIEQTHNLHHETLVALKAYRNAGDCPRSGLLLRGSSGNTLQKQGITAINLTYRVRDLAAAIGVHGASAHDGRHWWATNAARNGADVFRLQEAGGWASLEMPRRYVERAKIANQGLV